MRWFGLMVMLLLVACAAPPHLSPRQTAYNQLKKDMGKMEVAHILRGNRRVRLIQMGDPSDPKDDLEFWYYAVDADNDYVVFSFDGKLMQWEYHDPTQARR